MSETKKDPKTEVKGEDKSKVKAEAKHEAKTEAKHEAKSDIKAGTNSKPKDDDMKKALKKAEKKGRRKGRFARIRTFFVGIICGMLILTVYTAYMHGLSIKDTFRALFTSETAVEDHDLTLINHRIFGYKAADFAEAVLGEEEQLKKLEVYQREVSDVATLTQAGLFKIKAFSKYQYVTYRGTAVYTVDLSGLTEEDITLDENTKVVTMRVPAPVLEPINIQSENILFGDIEKGSVFAFGDIKLTPEQQADVETAAKEKMTEKLDEENVIEDAKLAAEHSIWEIFQPMVSALSSKYTLRIEFKE